MKHLSLEVCKLLVEQLKDRETEYSWIWSNNKFECKYSKIAQKRLIDHEKWVENNKWKTYYGLEIYKTLNLTEVIDLLPPKIKYLNGLDMFFSINKLEDWSYNIWYWTNDKINGTDEYIADYSYHWETPLQAIEFLLEYLLKQNLL